MSSPRGTLAQIALQRLSIKEIWERGLLDAPLPPSQLEELNRKITLDNLYLEGLLNRDMDINLFGLAVSKSIPTYLWPYLGVILLVSGLSPFTPEGEEYYNSGLPIKLTSEQYTAELQDVLALLLEDIINFLNQPGLAFGNEELTLSWAHNYIGVDPWKLITIPELPVEEEEEENIDLPSAIYYFETLDSLLAYLPPRILGESEEPSRLDRDQRTALSGMQKALRVNTETLWKDFERDTGVITQNFELSLNEFVKGARVDVMGDFLYVAYTLEDEGPYFSYYPREDALLILTSFFLNDERWKHSIEIESLKVLEDGE